MEYLLKWLQQPTSVAGLSTIVGAASAMLMHQLSWGQAIPILAGAVISIILPDNTDARAKAISIATDITKKLQHEGELS